MKLFFNFCAAYAAMLDVTEAADVNQLY